MIGWKMRSRGSRLAPVTAVVAAGLLAISACSGSSSGSGGGSGAYKIGINDDFSGPIAFAAKAVQGGLTSYIDYVNKEKGGVNGRKIDLKALDNHSDGAKAISNYRQQVQDGDIASVGYSSSVAWSAAGALADATKVTQLSISGVDKWTDESHPYLFKVGQTQAVALNVQGQFAKKFAATPASATKVGIMAITTASGPIFTSAVKKLAGDNGWKVAGSQAVDPGASDCSAQAAAVVASKPTFIMSNLESAGEDVVCFKALASRGYKGPIVNSFYSASEKTLSTLAAPNWYPERVFVWPTDATVSGAKAEYARAKKYGQADKVGDFFTDGYLMGMLIEKALQTCGKSCDAKKFRDAMESIKNFNADGLAGPHFGFTTGPDGHMAAPEGRIYQWDAAKGQAVPLTGWLCGLPARC